MSNGTLLTQFELLSGLADNNAKLITAADVQNIVKSNYQPVMIWSGYFIRDNSTDGGNRWYPRTNYYNPDFFKPRSTGVGVADADQIWRFTNRGNHNPNTTYTNVSILPDAWYGDDSEYETKYVTKAATFNLYTDGNGAVSSYDIVSPGQGWFGPAGLFSGGQWDFKGQTGKSNISGASANVEVEFIGPLTPNPVTNNSPQYYDSPCWFLSTNSNSPAASIPGQGASSDHTVLNTQVQHSLMRGKGQQHYNPGWAVGPASSQYGSSGVFDNQLSAQGLESGGSDVPNAVTLWRMPF